MIGSAQGRRPAPYLDAPCDVRQLARYLTRGDGAPDRHFGVIPGIWHADGLPEVMRGEETRMLGGLLALFTLFYPLVRSGLKSMARRKRTAP